MAGVYYGYRVGRMAHRRLVAALLHVDDAAHLADQVTQNKNLSGTNSLQNPQWAAALLERYYHLLRVSDTLTRFCQTAGISQMADAVLKEADADVKRVLYAVFAFTFNTWTRNVSIRVGVAQRSNWQLDTTRPLTVGEMDQEIGRLTAILAELPLGPALFPVLPTSREGEPPEQTSVEPEETFVSTLSESVFDTNIETIKDLPEIFDHLRGNWGAFAVDFRKYVNGIFIGTAVDIGATKFGDAVADRFGPTLGNAAEDTVRIVYEGTKAVVLIRGILSNPESTGSLIADGLTAGGFFADIKNLLANILKDAEKINKHEHERYRKSRQNAEYLDKMRQAEIASGGITLNITPDQQLLLKKGPECDQLRGSSVSRTSVALPSDGTDFSSATDARNFLGTTLTPPTPVPSSVPSNGQKAPMVNGPYGGLPGTYDNVEAAAFALLQDYVNRNPQFNAPRIDSSGLSFTRSDIALLIRREAAASNFQVPAITDADVMCTAVGFIPMRSADPVNLTTVGQLPSLVSLTALGTGVNVNAH